MPTDLAPVRVISEEQCQAVSISSPEEWILRLSLLHAELQRLMELPGSFNKSVAKDRRQRAKTALKMADVQIVHASQMMQNLGSL